MHLDDVSDDEATTPNHNLELEEDQHMRKYCCECCLEKIQSLL